MAVQKLVEEPSKRLRIPDAATEDRIACLQGAEDGPGV